ncbi:DNA-binding MarR family transcriptional regulator [Crossiella equi]|uniref:DNA-binding MarR family transcriptional regulator n=1 Tax=Crossiella equi TaxID=130796 RepID=A0ABS5ABM5_9PSEU|nr:MarR family transcriptional regulator [Crossiella equi]MBP2473095.1 DNA-binding MarR family transcriptional regulator [Crossiella equi]
MADAEWLDEDEARAWRGFVDMRARLSAHLSRELQKSGMSDADYSVLVGLSEAPAERLRLHELGVRLQWQKSRLSKQLTRMQDRGLVVREECPTDGRGAFAVLTEAGRQAIEAAAPLHVRQVREYFIAPLNREQLLALAEITSAVVARLEEDAPGE